MKNLLAKFFILFAAVGVIAGCRTAPVYNVEQQSIVTTVQNVKTDDVRKAIIRAGASLGWQMRDVKPGHIVGTLNLRKHMAKVDIKYSTKSYSILYKDSQNLKYDGSSIHKNYNGWIQNLQRNIDVQLNTL